MYECVCVCELLVVGELSLYLDVCASISGKEEPRTLNTSER